MPAVQEHVPATPGWRPTPDPVAALHARGIRDIAMPKRGERMPHRSIREER